MATTDQTPAVEYNPYAHETHDDPFPLYRRLRDDAPAYRNDDLGFWALSRYDDVIEALHDWETYTSSEGITLEPRSPLPMIITMDPPLHTKMRRLVSRAFTPRRVAALEPDIRRLTTSYLDEVTPNGTCDLIVDFSARLPMAVIATMLGVPDADRSELSELTDLMLHRDTGVPDMTPEGEAAGARVFQHFLDDVAAKRKSPGDDLTSSLLDVEIDGERLTDIDIVAFCFLLIIAGNETTTKLIGNAVNWLSVNPDQRRLIVDDPDLIPEAVEETLRYDGSTQLMARTLTRDVDKHGHTMGSGEKVLVLLGSANRDERFWDRADDFDIRRDHKQHLAFGHGLHVCLGAALARLEMRVSLEEIHRRIPDYVVDADGLVRMHSGNVRGYAQMPITFTPAPPLA
jgi:cytochrome P450